MCTHDDYVSPYLRRPLPIHEEIVSDEAARTRQVETKSLMHDPTREAIDDVEPTR